MSLIQKVEKCSLESPLIIVYTHLLDKYKMHSRLEMSTYWLNFLVNHHHIIYNHGYSLRLAKVYPFWFFLEKIRTP